MFNSSLFWRIVLWTLVVIIAFVFIFAIWFYTTLQQSGDRSSQKRFVIDEGLGVQAIAKKLESNGIVSSANFFTLAVIVTGRSNDLQAGDYVIPGTASINQIITLFTEGKTEEETVITILEGWSNKQIAEYLQKKGLGTANAFLDVSEVSDVDELFPDISFPSLTVKPKFQGLQGYLYPDTYRVFNDAKPEDVIFKMLSNFESKLTEVDRETMTEKKLSLYSVLTLASIVEREEMKSNDMPIVAGIFWKRLSINMPLQSDATINYVTGKDLRSPTLEDLKVESPYNTYLNPGLPPGPIGNPSIEAIRAVINYQESDYLFFLHPLSGETIYGRTLEEHNANKQKYLK